jgi:L,D-peptidoglycan transpeptidase YkuD (ErfK/YbiS/YcfS/YnhG family)
MQIAAPLIAALGVTVAAASDLGIPAKSTQALVVIAPTWSAPTAVLQRWTRADAENRWVKAGRPAPVLVGERGLGWGLGLHGVRADAGPRKVEGDRRAPAGTFRITGAFGRAARGPGKLPWQAITPTLEAVDDPASRFYNRIVERAQIARPDWQSSEHMAQIPDYALGIVVAHNPQHLPGSGSCIFLHLWLGQRRGTAGCTVLRERDLVELVRWLDPAQQPVLIQLPRAIAERELGNF